jgi:hypothetical protein
MQLLLNRRQAFFKPHLEAVSQILDAFIQIPKLCLRLLPHLASPDPLCSDAGNVKAVNLDPKWARNPLWRCVDHVLWTMRTLWEQYWRGQLPSDVLKFRESVSSVSASFSLSGSRASKLRSSRKGSGPEAVKRDRQAYAYEALNLLIQVIQFPGLLEDTAEGAYTAVYDLFYHGRHMFGDEFLDARRRFFEHAFEKHIVPSMIMPDGIRTTIFESPTEYIQLDAIQVDRAQRVQEAASLAIERLLLDNNSNEALLMDMLKVLNAHLSSAAGDQAKLEAPIATLSAIFYDSSIKNLTSEEIDLIVSMLSKFVLPLIQDSSANLILRIRVRFIQSVSHGRILIHFFAFQVYRLRWCHRQHYGSSENRPGRTGNNLLHSDPISRQRRKRVHCCRLLCVAHPIRRLLDAEKTEKPPCS